MKLENVNVDLMQVFRIIDNVVIMINADVTARLIDKAICNKEFIWNPSNCKCECDVGEYLDYENCTCRKQLVNKLVEECTEIVEEVKLAKRALVEHENVCKSSCGIYVVLFNNFYNQQWNWHLLYLFHCYLEKDVTLVKFGVSTQTTI